MWNEKDELRVSKLGREESLGRKGFGVSRLFSERWGGHVGHRVGVGVTEPCPSSLLLQP